jgi:hypothetical protein
MYTYIYTLILGVFTGTRLTSLGLVVRKIKEQKIFSYFWVQDALDAQILLLEELRVKVYMYMCMFIYMYILLLKELRVKVYIYAYTCVFIYVYIYGCVRCSDLIVGGIKS